MGIPRTCIYAVDIQFDADGHYLTFDQHSTLTQSHGKRGIIEQLKIQHPRLMLVGDGLNDYAAHDLVDCFVGYGGAFYRQNIAEHCQYYIKSPTLAPVLSLALTSEEVEKLTLEEKNLFCKHELG